MAVFQVMLRFLARVGVVLLPLGVASAQEWPSRHISVIVPFGPGNSVDISTRVVTAGMSEVLGQQVIVENIGGAGGAIGTTRAARATPDGYTLVVGGLDTFAQSQTLLAKPPYNPVTEFIPLGLMVDMPLILVGRNGLPPNNLQELIAYMKVNQNKMQFGSSGVGGATHLACVQVMQAVGVTLTHVPYRSAGAGAQDIVSNNLDLYCPAAGAVIPHIEAKTMKFFGTLADERSPLLPHLPSTGEQGLKGIDGKYWLGIFAPAGTPEPVVAKLSQAVSQALATPAVEARLRQNSAAIVAPDRRTPAYLQQYIPEQIAKWGKIIKNAGITPQ